MAVQKTPANREYRIVGLMSGTSLDGLDIALSEFHWEGDHWSFEISDAMTVEYPANLSELLANADQFDEQALSDLDRKLGEWMGNHVRIFLDDQRLGADAISSHGHTVYHAPELRKTLQIGNGRVMADIVGLPVIYDFRTADVAMGGQGAPLVPIGDLLLFPDFRFCLNLGGIANVSEKKNGGIVAHDICVCNYGLNYYATRKGLPFDKGGTLGRGGTLHAELVEKLNSLEYFSLRPPKSLDASFFRKQMLPILESSGLSLEDCMHALYVHLAEQIARSIGDTNDQILVTGGGAHNDFIVELLRMDGLPIVVPDDETVDYKEALVFAFMGLLRLEGQNNVLASVTGAPADHSAGVVVQPA